jgi:dTDP-4-amino-4,6-dideoxygalactose transaminase
MSSIRFFNPGLAYTKIRHEIDPVIERVLSTGQLILRQDVEEFEQNLAKYVGTKYAVAVASGTDALMLTLKALNIGLGDEVICPSYTFRATVEAIVMVGATPVLTDLGEDWRKYRTERTQAIIPAHIAGDTLDWFPEPGIVMIEDACQAIGAKPVEGIAACYSFYPAKLLGCYGDGGGIATNDEELYMELKGIRNHYKDDWKPYGWNSRLDNLQAAILNVKIKHLPASIWRRKIIASEYDKGMPSVIERPRLRNVYQDYIVAFKDESERDTVQAFLADKGIETMKNGYPFPEHSPKGARTLNYEARSLRLPCNEVITDAEVKTIIEALHEYYN